MYFIQGIRLNFGQPAQRAKEVLRKKKRNAKKRSKLKYTNKLKVKVSVLSNSNTSEPNGKKQSKAMTRMTTETQGQLSSDARTKIHKQTMMVRALDKLQPRPSLAMESGVISGVPKSREMTAHSRSFCLGGILQPL